MSMEEYINDIMLHGIPESWRDTLTMQSMYSLEEKGWKKKVKWKESTVINGSIGAFANEDIKEGEVTRKYKDRVNMIVIRNPEDFPPLTNITREFLPNYLFQVGGIVAIAIPGTSTNHSKERQNVRIVKISDDELHDIAIKDIKEDEEIFGNYEDFGTPPNWVLTFAKNHDMLKDMTFKGYNDYV